MTMNGLSLRSEATLVTVLLVFTAGAAAGVVAATDDAGSAAADTQAADAGSSDLAVAAQNATENEPNTTVPASNLTEGNVTVVNVGENVTLGPVQKVQPQNLTVYVGPNATTGPNVTSRPDGMQFNVSQQYYLGGLISGWAGAAPESINGTTNPGLNLSADTLYAISWVNVDGAPHNVVITNQTGNNLARTPVVSGTATAQTLVFRTPSEPGTYYCEVHPGSMRGEIELAMNVTANGTASNAE